MFTVDDKICHKETKVAGHSCLRISPLGIQMTSIYLLSKHKYYKPTRFSNDLTHTKMCIQIQTMNSPRKVEFTSPSIQFPNIHNVHGALGEFYISQSHELYVLCVTFWTRNDDIMMALQSYLLTSILSRKIIFDLTYRSMVKHLPKCTFASLYTL